MPFFNVSLEAKQEIGNKKIRSNLLAFCIVHLGKEKIYYVDEEYRLAISVKYEDIEDRCPWTYTTYPGASRAAKKMSEEDRRKWVVAIWIHPQWYFKPNDKYKLIRNCFPGCPTQ